MGEMLQEQKVKLSKQRYCCPQEPAGSTCARVSNPDKVNHAGQGAQLRYKDISVYSQHEYKVVLLSQQEPRPAHHSTSPPGIALGPPET